MKTDKEILDEYCAGWGLDEEGKKAMADTFMFKNHLLWIRIYDLMDAIRDQWETFLDWIAKKTA